MQKHNAHCNQLELWLLWGSIHTTNSSGSVSPTKILLIPVSWGSRLLIVGCSRGGGEPLKYCETPSELWQALRILFLGYWRKRIIASTGSWFLVEKQRILPDRNGFRLRRAQKSKFLQTQVCRFFRMN